MFAVSMNTMSKNFRKKFKCGKMDSYSGSEPRLFISFRLGNESNGQPLQIAADEEKMDTSDSFVTATSNVGNPSPTGTNTCSQPESEVNATSSEEVVKVAAMYTEERETVTDASRVNETPDPSVEVAQGPSAVEPNAVTTPANAAGPPNAESSSTDESCGAFIARKWEQLGCAQEPCTSSQAYGKNAKYSESVMMELLPGQSPADYEEADNASVSEVAFLDAPKLPPKSNLKSLYRPTEAKIQKLCVKMGDTRKEHSISDYETEGLSTSEGYFPSTNLRMLVGMIPSSGYHRINQGVIAHKNQTG